MMSYWLQHVTWWSMGAGFIVGVAIRLLIWVDERYVTKDWDPAAWPALLREAFLVGIAMAAISIPLNVMRVVIDEADHWLRNPWGGTQLGFAAATTIIALALFLFRKFLRIAYGLTEIAVGILGLSIYPAAPATTNATLSAPSAAWLIGGMSLIYIIIRGLDNVDVGWTKRAERIRAKEAEKAPADPLPQPADHSPGR